MEINVNKEICAYKEAVFFGLTTRQFVCSIAAIGIAVGTYFGLKGILGKETASWLCMIAALPVAAMGFFKYNSLTAEQLFWAIIKSEIIYAGRRVFKADNYYLYLLHTEQTMRKAGFCVKDIAKQHFKRKRGAKSTKKRAGIHSHRKNIR